MFSPETIALVAESWRIAARDVDGLTERFVTRLAQQAPHLARRLPTEHDRQRFVLCAMMSMVVSALDVMDSVEESIRALGERHQHSALTPEDFETFCSVFVEAVASHLGDASRPEHAEAWREALGRISAVMTEANGAAPALSEA